MLAQENIVTYDILCTFSSHLTSLRNRPKITVRIRERSAEIHIFSSRRNYPDSGDHDDHHPHRHSASSYPAHTGKKSKNGEVLAPSFKVAQPNLNLKSPIQPHAHIVFPRFSCPMIQMQTVAPGVASVPNPSTSVISSAVASAPAATVPVMVNANGLQIVATIPITQPVRKQMSRGV